MTANNFDTMHRRENERLKTTKDLQTLYLDGLMYLHDYLCELSSEPRHSTFGIEEIDRRVEELLNIARGRDQMVWGNLRSNWFAATSLRRAAVEGSIEQKSREEISAFIDMLLTAYGLLISMPEVPEMTIYERSRLKIVEREAGTVTVLALEGDILLGAESYQLRNTIKRLLNANRKNILLDMRDVNLVDSAGIGILVGMHQSVKASGGTLKLAYLSTKFRDVLQVKKLLAPFELYDDDSDAIASF